MQNSWKIAVALSLMGGAPARTSAEEAKPMPDWSKITTELRALQEVPSDAPPSYTQRVLQRAGAYALATGYFVGTFERREKIRKSLFGSFTQICNASGGVIRHPGNGGHIDTQTKLTGTELNVQLENRFQTGAGMIICDIDGEAVGAMIAVNQVSPPWSSVTFLDPAVVISDKVADAERNAAYDKRWREYLEWRQNVGEGAMTGCGRILIAKADIVEIADRRTGQARWVERRDLRQPHEGCPY